MNPLIGTGNCTLYIWYSEEGTERGHITYMLYNDPLLCGFNLPIKWLKKKESVVYNIQQSLVLQVSLNQL